MHSILYSQTPCLNMRPRSHWEAVFVDVGKHLIVKLSWTGACPNSNGWFLLLPFLEYIYSSDNVPHCGIPTHVCNALCCHPLYCSLLEPVLSISSFGVTGSVFSPAFQYTHVANTMERTSMTYILRYNVKSTPIKRTIDAMTIDKHLI